MKTRTTLAMASETIAVGLTLPPKTSIMHFSEFCSQNIALTVMYYYLKFSCFSRLATRRCRRRCLIRIKIFEPNSWANFLADVPSFCKRCFCSHFHPNTGSRYTKQLIVGQGMACIHRKYNFNF